MFKISRQEVEIEGKKIILETGKIARQADGAIIAPSACLAIFPVSRLIFFPFNVISFLKILNIYFLIFNLLITFLYDSVFFFLR